MHSLVVSYYLSRICHMLWAEVDRPTLKYGTSFRNEVTMDICMASDNSLFDYAYKIHRYFFM